MKHKKRRFPIILNPSSAPVLAANDNDHFITLSLSTENSDSVPNSEMDQNEEGEMKNVASTDFGLKPLATTLETVGKLKSTTPGRRLRMKRSWLPYVCTKRCLSSCALNSRWVLWSNVLFFAGNICYLVIDVMMLKLGANNEQEYEENAFSTSSSPLSTAETLIGNDESSTLEWFESETLFNYLNFAAALLFLANPITDFMGSWAEKRASTLLYDASAEAVNLTPLQWPDSEISTSKHQEPEEESEIDYDKIGAIIFFIGSAIFLLLAFFDWKNPDYEYYETIDVIGTHVFILNAVVCVIGWKVNRNQTMGTHQERFLYSFDPYLLDWSGWGDWSFLLGSFLDGAISYLDYAPLQVQYKFSFISDILWTLNAILYTIGYFYGQNVRKRFANQYYTSLAHLNSATEGNEEELARERAEREAKKKYFNFSVQSQDHTAIIIP